MDNISIQPFLKQRRELLQLLVLNFLVAKETVESSDSSTVAMTRGTICEEADTFVITQSAWQEEHIRVGSIWAFVRNIISMHFSHSICILRVQYNWKIHLDLISLSSLKVHIKHYVMPNKAVNYELVSKNGSHFVLFPRGLTFKSWKQRGIHWVLNQMIFWNANGCERPIKL